MTDVAFYQLERSPLEQVLSKLLEKTLDAGKRALVVAGSEARIEALNGALWSYYQDSWLPHGSAKDGDPTDQPIWLSASDKNVNGADFLFLTDGTASDGLAHFERCFDLFDGNDEVMVAAARERWKRYKDTGNSLTYWQQTGSGGWEEKAGT